MGRFRRTVGILAVVGLAASVAPATAEVVAPTRPPLTGSVSSGGHSANWIITGANTCPDYMVAVAPTCSGTVEPGTLVTLQVTLTGTNSSYSWFTQHADLTNTNLASSPVADVKNADYGWVPAGTSHSVTWTLNLRASTPRDGNETMMARFWSSSGEDGVQVLINLYNPWSNPSPAPSPTQTSDPSALPGTPLNLQIGRLSKKKARITWAAPVDGGSVDQYVLSVRAKAPGRRYGAWKTWDLTPSQTAVRVSFPTKHVKVQAFVWAENSAGSGSATATVTRKL